MNGGSGVSIGGVRILRVFDMSFLFSKMMLRFHC